MAKEYIEQSTVLAVISGKRESLDAMVNHNYARAVRDVYGVVCRIPTADVTEVVRCKDCKHAKLDIMEKGLVVCRRPVLKNGQLLPFNWETKYADFCSYGELKEREGK